MIHILTLSWNGLDKLKRLEAGLYRTMAVLFGVTSWKWYIRDNGSTDGTVAEIETWTNVEVLAVNHNRDNFAQGMNSLVKLANPKPGDMILLLNNDVEFIDELSVSNMYELMQQHNAGAVGARLLYNGTNKLQHAGVIFGPKYGNMPYHYRHKEESDAASKKNRIFQAVTAAVCLVDAKSFLTVNAFDENFRWAFDDIDLMLKLNQIKPVLYCGQTTIYHEESASLKKNPVNKMFLQHNVNYFKSKWFGKYKLDHELYLNDPNYNLL